MTINNKEFEQYIERNQISDRLNELAGQIDADYAGKSVVMLAVLNGAFIFAGDLIRLLKVDAEISFVKLKSYKGTASTGEVQTLIGLMHELKDREVLIVEDIIDTGRTMSKLLEMVWEQSPASVKVCTLLVKPDVFKNSLTTLVSAFLISLLWATDLTMTSLAGNCQTSIKLKTEVCNSFFDKYFGFLTLCKRNET